MRKTLWGYHVEETDDMIDSLQSQIELLTARVTNLNTELAEKNARMNEAEPSRDNSGESEALRAECDRLKNENQQLKAALADQPKDHTKEQSETARVGEICRRAYEDMEAMKQQTAEEMASYIQRFNAYTSETNQKLQQAMEGMQDAKAQAHEIFLLSAEAILENYEVIEQENNKFHQELAALNEQKQEAIRKTEKLIETFTQKQEFIAVDGDKGSADTGSEEENPPSRLERALSHKEKKLAPVSNGSSRIIGVNTHVKKNDIFGENSKSS